jgi:very-short-patch-repair endonuclease
VPDGGGGAAVDDVSRLVVRLGGVATRAEIVAATSREALEAAVATGAVRRIARGRYATLDLGQAVTHARSVSGVLSGLSAAGYWGWAVKWPPEKTEVTVPRNRSRARYGDGLLVRRRDLPESAVVDGVVTSRVQTVLDCAARLPFDEALSVADSALRDPELMTDDLHAALGSVPRNGRSRVSRVVESADGGAANPFESCVRAVALEVPGLAVRTQVQVGTTGWVDLADPNLRIVIECDSWEFHSGEDLFRRDVRRYTDMVRAGWLVVRFVWEDAMHRPDRIRDVLSDVVALRRASGSSHGPR